MLSVAQQRLLVKIMDAYEQFGAQGCTAQALWARPQGREYARLRELDSLGVVDVEAVVAPSGRKVLAYIPRQAVTAATQDSPFAGLT